MTTHEIIDVQHLCERLPTLVEYAAENPTGQRLWRMRGKLGDPECHEIFTGMIADFRRTAAELREIATELEQAAVTAERWLRPRA